jgi:hypothetical protein
MIRTLLRRGLSTSADYLSTRGLKMFGSGDYPQALDYSRPFRTSFPSRFVEDLERHHGRIIADVVKDRKVAGFLVSISVFIKCGSRNETEETSGVAHFLEHLHFKGTKNRTRDQLEL